MSESMSAAVRELFEKYPMNHEFSLWDLKRAVWKLHPKSKYSHGETFSRRLRQFRYGRGFAIVCIEPLKSKYKKVKFELKLHPKKEKAV